MLPQSTGASAADPSLFRRNLAPKGNPQALRIIRICPVAQQKLICSANPSSIALNSPPNARCLRKSAL